MKDRVEDVQVAIANRKGASFEQFPSHLNRFSVSITGFHRGMLRSGSAEEGANYKENDPVGHVGGREDQQQVVRI